MLTDVYFSSITVSAYILHKLLYMFCLNLHSFFLLIDTRTTQWEDPRLSNPNIAGQAVPYSRDYKQKYEYFKSQLRKPVSYAQFHFLNLVNVIFMHFFLFFTD